MMNVCVTTQNQGDLIAFFPRTFFTIQGSEIASEISFEPKQ